VNASHTAVAHNYACKIGALVWQALPISAVQLVFEPRHTSSILQAHRHAQMRTIAWCIRVCPCRAVMADMQQRRLEPHIAIWTSLVSCHAEMCEPGRWVAIEGALHMRYLQL
jgi:hypothetical protein